MQVANTILAQLGGNKFIAMTGAKMFVGSEKGLTFRIGRNDAGINCVRITLTAMDDYQVEFLKVSTKKVSSVAFAEGVYADNLQEVFTRKTGLETRLF